jgi:hypothetical protein
MPMTRSGESRDGDGRRVGGEDDAGARDAVEVAKEVALDLEALGGGFNEEIAA